MLIQMDAPCDPIHDLAAFSPLLPAGRWFFRGDSISDKETFEEKLRPTVGQPLKFAGLELDAQVDATEFELFQRFRRFAYDQLRPAATSAWAAEWEAIFLARHYELPVRILDWSTSPYVALYFALSARRANPPSEACVWGIFHPEDHPDIDVLDEQSGKLCNMEALRPVPRPGDPPLHRHQVFLLFPVYNSGRLTAQKGVFTWHSHPEVPLTTYASTPILESPCVTRIWSCRVTVDHDQRVQMLRDLDRIGVSQRTIIPDLIGLTAGLVNTEVLFNTRSRRNP